MRVFKTKLIRLQLTAEELDALTADFISYKRDGVLPDIFGRDALYDDSFTWPLIKFERVAHIHLANVNNPFPHSCANLAERMTKRIWYIVRVRLMSKHGCSLPF